jgi:hypothetical protein
MMKKRLITLIAALNLASVATANDNNSIPHKFNSGETISSSQMNENFQFVTPLSVYSNGTRIGYLSDFSMYGANLTFFNENLFITTINRANGEVVLQASSTMISFTDSNCSAGSELVSFGPGAVFKMGDVNNSSWDNNTQQLNEAYFTDMYYIPPNAQAVAVDNSTPVYSYNPWRTPSSSWECSENIDYNNYSTTQYLYSPQVADPEITGIQNGYATPITIGK